MKKIGVITFHESDNYGTCLQAFAVTKIVEQLGYDCEILNYRRQSIPSQTPSLLSRMKYMLKAYGIRNLGMRKEVAAQQKKQKERFEDFRKEHLEYSTASYHSGEELRQCVDQYDAFVTGSDMVWCSDRSESLDVYFLQFAPKNKRIAYAPSFGSAQICGDLKPAYQKYLAEFEHLSCREESGVALIKELAEREAALTVDPTLACNKSVWESFTAEKVPNGPYILVYMFEGMPTWLRKTVRKVAARYQAEILEVPMGAKQWCNSIRKGQDGISPSNFVALFKNAKFVFTNSYHGLMFSLIFNKQFFVISRDNGGHWAQFEDRLTGILRMIHCENRVLCKNQKADLSGLVDYRQVNTKLDQLKADSLVYLNNALHTAVKE